MVYAQRRPVIEEDGVIVGPLHFARNNDYFLRQICGAQDLSYFRDSAESNHLQRKDYEQPQESNKIKVAIFQTPTPDNLAIKLCFWCIFFAPRWLWTRDMRRWDRDLARKCKKRALPRQGDPLNKERGLIADNHPSKWNNVTRLTRLHFIQWGIQLKTIRAESRGGKCECIRRTNKDFEDVRVEMMIYEESYDKSWLEKVPIRICNLRLKYISRLHSHKANVWNCRASNLQGNESQIK